MDDKELSSLKSHGCSSDDLPDIKEVEAGAPIADQNNVDNLVGNFSYEHVNQQQHEQPELDMDTMLNDYKKQSPTKNDDIEMHNDDNEDILQSQ